MIIKMDFIKHKRLRLYSEHIVYFCILFILIPSFVYFEVSIVLPTVAVEWSIYYLIHLLCISFLLLNIIGNMIYGMFTNTSITKNSDMFANNYKNWSFCEECKSHKPPRSWHCEICKICILKRDHHCTFLAGCVGYYNLRYFFFFTFYVFVAMIYAFYFNMQFSYRFLTWSQGFVILKFLFPLANFAVDCGYESFYILLIVINIIVAIFTGFLLCYHARNLLKGKTAAEMKLSSNEFLYDYGWKKNLEQVFGKKWYLAWIAPFITSSMPGNGTFWLENQKNC